MGKFDPLTRRMTRGTFRGGRGFQRRRGMGRAREGASGYNWSTFQREDRQLGGCSSLAHVNIPPPKPIMTIRFEEEGPEEGTSGSKEAESGNICSRWLAKNSRFQKPKADEVVLDDSEFLEPDEEDVIVIDSNTPSPQKLPENSMKTEMREIVEISEDDDSVVIIEEVERSRIMMTNATTTKITPPQFWSQPTCSSPSSSKNNRLTPQKLRDCFSKECDAFQRVPRQWAVVADAQRALSPTAMTSSFTVCSYNVLCQKTILRTGHLYRHLKDSKFLEWKYRWEGLKSELPTFDADILGLQEVQADHFKEDFEPFMRNLGYDGVYKQKHGTEQKDDGCALFYRPEKFEKLGYQEVNYFISSEAISNRENIGQILVLRCRATSEVLLVANTHLLFNQERGDVKLAQLAILFAYIHKLSKDLEQVKPLVMVMGDFNMEHNSKVYDFIVKGKLHIEGQYVRTLSGQSLRPGGKMCISAELLNNTNIGMDSMFRAIDMAPPLLTGKLTHPFKFYSAYHLKKGNELAEQRAVSTFHKDAAAPDFIFFTPDSKNGNARLRLLETFALPTMDTLLHATPWPNQHVPSDHLPLMAKFRLTKRSG